MLGYSVTVRLPWEVTFTVEVVGRITCVADEFFIDVYKLIEF